MWNAFVLSCFFVHCAIANKYRLTNSDERPIAIGITWDTPTNNAFYVDFGVDSTKECIFRYDAAEDQTYSAYIEGHSLGPPSFITPVKTDGHLKKFAVGFKNFVGVVHWDGESDSAQLVDELFDLKDRLGPNERVGFGHSDISGHSLYVGTKDGHFCGPSANQSVYVKQSGYSYKQVLTDMKVPHGFAFTDDYVYVIDSCTLIVWELKSSKHKGAYDKPRVAFDFKSIGKKSPDFYTTGLTADRRNGLLFTTSYYDGHIWAIDPVAGKARIVAELPKRGSSEIKFAGSGRDVYVTVASRILDDTNGRTIGHEHPDTAMYQIRGLGSGFDFKRLRI